MKTMYVCDKCGKQFMDCEECDKHESEHWILNRGYSDLDSKLSTMTEYKEGQEEPNIINVWFERWNRDKCEYEKRCGKYKLVSSYEAPIVIDNE